MLTATIAATYTVGGISFTSQASRQAVGQIGHVLTLPAGVAGAISAAGVDGLADGHGFEALDVVDVHWTDPADGSHKCRRGVTIDTANANDIEFDNDPAAEGDALPAEDTAVVVAQRAEINTDFDGDDAKVVAARCGQRAVVDFRSAAASLSAVKLPAAEAWSWMSDQGVANPLTGDPVDKAVASNGSTTAAALNLGILYDSAA